MKRMRKKIALFGGAFDPPHRGHVAMVRKLVRQRGIAAVWIVPVARHPFGKPMSPFARRFAMCRLAFGGLSKQVTIKRAEQQLRGTSYTVRTLKALHRRSPGIRFAIVLGSDSFKRRQRWKDFAAIQTMADLIIFKRGRHSAIPNVSSTAVRNRTAAARPIADLVPKRVADYIERKKLYRK